MYVLQLLVPVYIPKDLTLEACSQLPASVWFSTSIGSVTLFTPLHAKALFSNDWSCSVGSSDMVNDVMFCSAKQISAQEMNRNNEKKEQINEQGQERTQHFS